MTDTLVRSTLLSLHRALVEFERRAYEKTHGRTASGTFLQALVRDPSLSWLAPLTSLLVRFDELGESKGAAAQRTCRARALSMLRARGKGEFAAKYAARIQLSPDIAFAHGAAMRALARP